MHRSSVWSQIQTIEDRFIIADRDGRLRGRPAALKHGWLTQLGINVDNLEYGFCTRHDQQPCGF